MTAARAFAALRVADVERLCDDAVAVTFDVPSDLGDRYEFTPGQSLTLRRVVDGHEHRRSYSICAPAGRPLRIGVRAVPDGLFSSWLVDEVAVGDEIEVQPPSGSFGTGAVTGTRHLCVAAGSGITPVLSIAASVLAEPDARVTLLYGNRSTSSVMFAEELADLKNTYPSRFQVVHVLSREQTGAELGSGRLDPEHLRRLLEAFVPVEALDHVWLCGPHAMVDGARAVLDDLGVPSERVHTELFYVDEPPPELHRAGPVVDGATSAVTVVLDGIAATTALPVGRTILDGAQASRTDLPYACKGGVCGTCRARVTHGEVEMQRNYALEPAEVAAGFVLTCQSFPVTDEVTVDFDA
ncbi:MAG: 1,2-phenylacetyl-CoA epoxidase subunit PaaE [Marmoricola sp.]